MHQLKSIQHLPVGIEKCWDFFSDPHNLFTITPPALNLKVRNDIFGNEAYPGQIITYTVKPLLGLPIFWMTEITHVEPLKMFVDEQRKGPYSIWHHEHHFRPVEGGVEMLDLVHYALPLGSLGNLMHPLVKKKLLEIFQFRFQKIIEVFGPWPNEKMMVEIR